MPGRASGEVMLALTHQEAKTKEKEQETSCKFQVVSCKLHQKAVDRQGLPFYEKSLFFVPERGSFLRSWLKS